MGALWGLSMGPCSSTGSPEKERKGKGNGHGHG